MCKTHISGPVVNALHVHIYMLAESYLVRVSDKALVLNLVQSIYEFIVLNSDFLLLLLHQ